MLMESLSEDDQFFDSKGYITSVSDWGSDGVDKSDSESRVVVDEVVHTTGYEVWIRSPGTVNDRREKLMRLMGLVQNDGAMGDKPESPGNVEGEFMDNTRIMENKWAVLRSRIRELRYSSSMSSVSSCSSETQELFDMAVDENLVSKIRNLDDETEYVVDEVRQEGLFRRLSELRSGRSVNGETFKRLLGLSPLGKSEMIRDDGVTSNKPVGSKSAGKRWLKKLGVVALVADTKQERIDYVEAGSSLPKSKHKNHIVKARIYRKQSKEFSALYMEQDIDAHKSGILTMKFSPDGQLLASAGEDEIVRIWQVIESQRSNLVNVPDVDSPHVYFVLNHLGELEPINVSKSKRARIKSLRKSWESACVIFPQNGFQLAEKPLHEFQGHSGEILDLSWSDSKCLLSSSADKTVRLWRVGFHQCLKVFSHNSFVTCVQFNPVDENHFISGSVDGKVLIWSIARCEVVDWTDIKEIVTAICYKPDGKGAIVGSMTGDCYFYDTSENHLKMTNQTSLHGRKKTTSKRITGFQFSPGDPSKLTVTMADSQVRILKGVDVIFKYKGLRNAGSQISTSFASEGTHIVSASEDSFVYVWGYTNTDGAVSSAAGSKMSCERFFSNNASVAIPWCASATPCKNMIPSLFATSSSLNPSEIMVRYSTENGLEHNPPVENLNHRFSLGFPEPNSRRIATWPEEKLTSLNSLTVSSTTSKSEYIFLKTTCQNIAGSTHAWGSVIVTAGWDGRIRVFQNYGLPVRNSLVN